MIILYDHIDNAVMQKIKYEFQCKNFSFSRRFYTLSVHKKLQF